MNKIQSLLANTVLVKKIAITFALLIACRLGSFLPVPGIDSDLAVSYFNSQSGTGTNLFQTLDSFTGGAFSKLNVTALSVFPYITASIVLQLLMTMVPSLQREIKENPEHGRRKIGRWTRIFTLGLALVESAGLAKFALGINQGVPGVISPYLLQFELLSYPFLFYAVTMITVTTGTLILMWIGEQITEMGIGNGISLIISANILSTMPSAFARLISMLSLTSQSAGRISLIMFVILMILFVVIIAGTIQITQAQRKIPVQYSRRQVGFGTQSVASGSSHLPLKLNYAGVLPVIFANTLLLTASGMSRFFKTGLLGSASSIFSQEHPIGMSLYIFLIIFFSFFWTATQFNPVQIVSDMKKNGAFIPGVRQGKATISFLEETMVKITFFGSIALAFIAVLPVLITRFFGIDHSIGHSFGGTSLLILVGVVLETAKQIDSHLMMDRYQGFMRKKRLKSKKSTS